MHARFVKADGAINYTPGADVAAGTVVVQGNLVGITKIDIAADQLGALATQGVFDIAKATGGGEAIAVGADLFWDAGNEVVTTSSNSGANKKIAKAIAAAGDDDETVRGCLIRQVDSVVANQVDSEAADLAAMIVDFNALLAKLQAAGVMATA